MTESGLMKRGSDILVPVLVSSLEIHLLFETQTIRCSFAEKQLLLSQRFRQTVEILARPTGVITVLDAS